MLNHIEKYPAIAVFVFVLCAGFGGAIAEALANWVLL